MNQPVTLLQPGTQQLLRQPQSLKFTKRVKKPRKSNTNSTKTNEQNSLKSNRNMPTRKMPNRKLPTCNMPTSTSTRKPTYKPINKSTIKSMTPELTALPDPTHRTIFAINPS